MSANGAGPPRTLRPLDLDAPDWWAPAAPRVPSAAPGQPPATARARPAGGPPDRGGAAPGPPGPRRTRRPGGLLVGLLVAATTVAQVAAFLSLRSPGPQPAAPVRLGTERPARLGTERPGPGNTGVPDGVALRPSGAVAVLSEGAVIQGLDIDGPVEIRADRVTIRHSRVRGGPHWGIRIAEGITGALIDEVEIAPSSPAEGMDAIRADGAFTGRRLDIHGTGDGVKAGSGTRLEASWVHDLASGPKSHSDAVQTRGGSGIVLVGNRLEGGRNAAVMASTELTPITGLVIERNWLDGGNYTLNIRAGEHGPPSGVRVVGNRFGHGATYGPAVIDGPFEQAGNRWAGGKAVRL
jgi:Right handed beta helix region